MKLIIALITLLTVMVIVPTAVSRPSITDPTTRPAFLGRSVKRRSIQQASSVSLQPVQLDTNAKRFANGLPPLPPSKSRRHNASPVRRAGASPIPASPITCTSCSGVIEVYNTNTGSRIGYISAVGYGSQLYQVQPALDSNTLRVHFAVPSGSTGTVTNMNVMADNSKFASKTYMPCVGLAAGAWNGAVTAGGGSSPARMIGTAQLAANSRPATGNNSWGDTYKIESAVWAINLSTSAMTLKWINPDGTTAPGLPFSSDNAIMFGDRAEWVYNHPSLVVIPISLKFAI